MIYQVYPRSFADADGDGTGDLAGVRSRLPYLAELGVDALWSTPWYRSPQNDGGYDVADYRAIDPMLGTLKDAEALVPRLPAHVPLRRGTRGRHQRLSTPPPSPPEKKGRQRCRTASDARPCPSSRPPSR